MKNETRVVANIFEYLCRRPLKKIIAKEKWSF